MIEKLLEEKIIDGYKYTNIDLILLNLSKKATEKEIEFFPKELLKDEKIKKLLVDLGVLLILGSSKQIVACHDEYFRMTLLNSPEILYINKNPILKEVLSSTVMVDINDYVGLELSKLKNISVSKEYHKPNNLMDRFKNEPFRRMNQISGWLNYQKELWNLMIDNEQYAKDLMMELSLNKMFSLQTFLKYPFWKKISNVHQKYNPKEYSEEKLKEIEDSIFKNNIGISTIVNYYFDKPSENLLSEINSRLRKYDNFDLLSKLNEINKDCQFNGDLTIFYGYENFIKSNPVLEEDVEVVIFKVSLSALVKEIDINKNQLKNIVDNLSGLIDYRDKSGDLNKYLESICGITKNKAGDIYILADNLNSQEQKEYVKAFLNMIIYNTKNGKLTEDDDKRIILELIENEFLSQVIPENNVVRLVNKF